MVRTCLVALALGLLLVSCRATAEDGTRISTAQQAKMVKGVTTEAEVRSLLGAPKQVTEFEDGRTLWVYAWSQATATATGKVTHLEVETYSVYLREGLVDDTEFVRTAPPPE
jgi:outer membrane protein assembly factor BamE (lipoprotein component of BamABCDE complex)